MPNFSLQLKGDFQNVTGLVPADGVETELLVQLECTSCHELHPRAVALLPSNVDELQNSRGQANLVMNCPNCRKENSAKFALKGDAKMGSTSPWQAVEVASDAAPSFHTLCTVEFRGIEPKEPTIDGLLAESSSWQCRGSESGTPFSEVSFDDGEWHDYDEKQGDEVGITDVELRWQRV